MPRFAVTREGRRIDVAFDDGGVNLLSSEALRELGGVVADISRLARPSPDDGSSPGDDPSSTSPAGRGVTDAANLLVFRSSHASIFAAGADMAEMQQFTALDAAEFARLGQETFLAIERLPMATIAIVDGDCFGGALDLVLSFDLRFATPRSRFSHPGGKLGIVTGFGGTSRWRKVLEPAAARSLFLGNPVLSAAEAHDLGLVDRVAVSFEEELSHVESLDLRTVQFVKELTTRTSGLTQRQLAMVADRLGHIYFGTSRDHT